MHKNTKVLIATAVTATVMSTGVMAPTAFAQEATSNGLVAALADKFKLQPRDIQAVINQYVAKEQATRLERAEVRLDQAVADGKITSHEKDLIIGEIKTIQQRMINVMSIADATDRRKALEQLQSDVKAWAYKNGIDMSWLATQGSRTKSLWR